MNSTLPSCTKDDVITVDEGLNIRIDKLVSISVSDICEMSKLYQLVLLNVLLVIF